MMAENFSETSLVILYASATVAVLFILLFAISLFEQRKEARRRYLQDLAESRARLRLALWGSGEWLWEFQFDKAALRCREFSRYLGYAEIDTPVTLSRVLSVVHPQDRKSLLRIQRAVSRGRMEVDETLRVRNAQGEYRWVRWRGKVAVVDRQGMPLRVTGTCKDISEERAAELQLKLAAQVMERGSDAVAIVGTDFKVININPSFTRITGYKPDEIIGRPVTTLCHPEQSDHFSVNVKPALDNEGSWEGEVRERHKSGREYYASCYMTRINNELGETTHYIVMFSDVTKRREFERRLHYLANYDNLTGLLTRNSFLERLAHALEDAERSKAKAAVLFIDLDGFKRINDSLGHAAGDAVLRATAKRITHTLRADDVVARFGGDEFTVILEKINTVADAEAVAAKLLNAFRRELDMHGHSLRVTPSIGISVYPDHGQDGQLLIECADTAMYQAKKAGRGRYSLYEALMSISARGRFELENQLGQAMERDEFELHYQPVIDAVSNRLLGFEALLRWNNPVAGLMMPGEFIPLAEEHGSIVAIGEWVLRQAVADLARLQAGYAEPLYMSVNVSARQVRDPDFVESVAAILKAAALPPDTIRLELTESLLLDGDAAVEQTLLALRELGTVLVLDDFGTGYSSLSYLRRFPIGHLKIEKVFVQDVPDDEYADSIVRTIVLLANVMDIGVTAEGVEKAEQSRFLAGLGCIEQQGYHFSKPLPVAELIEWLQQAQGQGIETRPVASPQPNIRQKAGS